MEMGSRFAAVQHILSDGEAEQHNIDSHSYRSPSLPHNILYAATKVTIYLDSIFFYFECIFRHLGIYSSESV